MCVEAYWVGGGEEEEEEEEGGQEGGRCAGQREKLNCTMVPEASALFRSTRAGSFRAVPNRGPGTTSVPAVKQSLDCGCPSEVDTTLGAQVPSARGHAEEAPQLGPGSPAPKRGR